MACAQRRRLRLDAVAARVARNGLQIKDAASTPPLTADALFFRASVVNSCHGGAASAAWEFDGKRKTLTVRALRALVAGDEAGGAPRYGRTSEMPKRHIGRPIFGRGEEGR